MGLSAEQIKFYREQYERLWPYLQSAMLTYGETHSKDDLWNMVQSGHAQLWPMNNAAMLLTIEEYPSGLKEANVWLAGGDIDEIRQWEPVIEDFCKSQGCTRSVIKGRRGWLRALKGYREVATIMIKDFV